MVLSLVSVTLVITIVAMPDMMPLATLTVEFSKAVRWGRS